MIWRPLSQSPLSLRRSPGGHSARGRSPLYSRGSTIRRDRDPSAWRRCGPAWCTRFRSARPRWPRCWLWSPPGANGWPRRRCSPDHRRCNRRRCRPPAATCGWTCLRCSSSTWNLEREIGRFHVRRGSNLRIFLSVSTVYVPTQRILRDDNVESLPVSFNVMGFTINVLEMLPLFTLRASKFLSSLARNLQRCIFRRFPRNDVSARGIKME